MGSGERVKASPRSAGGSRRRIGLTGLALAMGLLLWARYAERAEAPPAGTASALPSPAPLAELPSWQDGLIALDIATSGGRAIALYDVAAGAAAAPRLLVDRLEAVAGLDWSPDGKWLVYGARIADNWDLYAILRQGGQPQRLTQHPAFDGHPAWSPDGSQLAFESARDGQVAIYAMSTESLLRTGLDEPGQIETAPDETGPLQTSLADSGPLQAEERPILPMGAASGLAIEPAWSPDGEELLAAVWVDGRFRLEAWAATEGAESAEVAEDGPGLDTVAGQSASPESVAVEAAGSADPARLYRPDEDDAGYPGDARLPKMSPKGGRWALLGLSGSQRILKLADWPDGTSGSVSASRTLPVSAAVQSFDWSPEGGALAYLTQSRGGSELQIVAADGKARKQVAKLPGESGALAWTAGSMPSALLSIDTQGFVQAARSSADPELRVGLERIPGVSAPGPRLNAALIDDFEAMRAELQADLGVDFLARLSDAWRSLGATESSFFSWHKTGRAFDIAQEYRSPDGGTGMVIVAEPIGGHPFWRIYLRAGKQDGSVGAPLRDPGWDFYARHSGDPLAEQAGGRRRTRIPNGYYVDFTAIAAAHGFQRIPALTGRDMDWRNNWSAIEFWHFERRDGLSWYAAARQAYPDEILVAELNADRLRQLGQAGRAFGRVGIPRNLGLTP